MVTLRPYRYYYDRAAECEARGDSAGAAAVWQEQGDQLAAWQERFPTPRKSEPVEAIHGPQCIHLGKPLEQPVKVACKGCGGRPSSIERRAFECAIYGRCLPHFRGPWKEEQQDVEAKLYHLCLGGPNGCDRRELPPAFGDGGEAAS